MVSDVISQHCHTLHPTFQVDMQGQLEVLCNYLLEMDVVEIVVEFGQRTECDYLKGLPYWRKLGTPVLLSRTGVNTRQQTKMRHE